MNHTISSEKTVRSVAQATDSAKSDAGSEVPKAVFHGQAIPAGWSLHKDIIIPITRDAFVERANGRFRANRDTETGHDLVKREFDNVADACQWADRVNHADIKRVDANRYSIRGAVCLEYSESGAHVGAARLIFIDSVVYLCGLDARRKETRSSLMFKYANGEWVSLSSTKTAIGPVLRISLGRPWVIGHKMDGGMIDALALCQFRIKINTADDSWSTDSDSPEVGGRAAVIDF